MYKRILVKLSGEALAGNEGKGFSRESAIKVAEQVKELVNQGIEVALLVGGGNIWRGKLGEGMDMARSHQIGMMATVVNAMYVEQILGTVGVKAKVVTPFNVGRITEEYESEKISRHFEKGEVVVFAGGTGHPFFTTDTGAAINAIKIQADALFLAKNVDGVYDKDPKKYDDAKKYDEITFDEVLDKKLGVMDLTATTLCMENNMNILVFDLNNENSIVNHVNGKITGTLVKNA